ncbi:hypothetical protein MYCTH_2311903 [Thermothelomyces thermophilus ATCC 42464]|uniref:Carboxylesterase family protein n=1 Tax=Thermothelomyces thermophilus (strain ATCC 42464 / BCRC 31852 / DSM 1799) TaxID=573729 RepID=G2QPT1_THET4|nr:uncharacterized protein MYCTH_2311903 [Thermothelomyces thermophilus ATCC 42464]AEO61594.1 hypothetical protein MYCTH_2311903 [Thermothelomyces thermophilus ATCC 42464]
MATTPRPRPCAELDIHDDHSHYTTTALGELSLNKVHNIRRKTSVESLARRLDNFHIHNSDKENKSRLRSAGAASQDPVFEGAQEPKSPQDFENGNPLALASQQVRSTKEQLLRHQEGQFEWLLSVPVKTAAKERRPRGDSHGDAELGRGEKTLYFGCNLVNRKPQSDGILEDGESTDIYTLLATRVKAEEDFIIERAPVFDEMEATAADQPRLGDDTGASKASSVPVAGVNGVVASASDDSGEHSRPLSRIEDSVEALDKLEEEIEAVAEVAQLERVLSPEAASQNSNAASAKSTPVKRATSVRAPPDPAKSKTVGRSSSVRNKTTSSGDDEKATTSSARKVPRPASLLPPKPLAKSSKPPTTSNFELPGEAVARQLKERRAQRLSQQISAEQAAALAAAYSPSRPHVKSSKPPTRPTFELPGEAISRRKREKREAELRAQEEEERKRREFKARPIRASLVPTTVPRETLASLARQKARATTEGSADSASTTVTPVSKKRQSATITTPSSTCATRTTTPAGSAAATLPIRGRNPTASAVSDSAGQPAASPAPRAASTSSSAAASTHSRASKVSAEEAAQQKLRGKEVFARDNSLTAEREREKRERERAAKEAREKAAERSRELSRQWAEKQRLKKEAERRKGGEGTGAPASSSSSPSPAAAAAAAAV